MNNPSVIRRVVCSQDICVSQLMIDSEEFPNGIFHTTKKCDFPSQYEYLVKIQNGDISDKYKQHNIKLHVSLAIELSIVLLYRRQIRYKCFGEGFRRIFRRTTKE